jgi:hypothetical protein
MTVAEAVNGWQICARISDAKSARYASASRPGAMKTPVESDSACSSFKIAGWFTSTPDSLG